MTRSPKHRSPRNSIDYALVYPNTFAVGISNLGVHALRRRIGNLEGATVELVFSDTDEGRLDKGRPSGFDLICFSLSFEGDYPALAALLSGSGIPPLARDRNDAHPLIVVGGFAPSLNPEPLADIADLIFIGEAEGGFDPLHDYLRQYGPEDKKGILKAIADDAPLGWYAPSLMEGVEVQLSRAPAGWEPVHSTEIAQDDAFGGAFLMEISRGCPHGCRFCAAGHLSRPVRFIEKERLEPVIDKGMKMAGRIGLVGAAVSDHPDFKHLARRIIDGGKALSVSSFRAENLDFEAALLLKSGGLKTLTIALESASDRVRAGIGKKIGVEDVIRGAELAREAGIKGLRIYAMVGLPGETDEDAQGLVEVVRQAKKAMVRGTVTLSVTPFVPKPNTPLQWEPMAAEKVVKKRLRAIQGGAGQIPGVKVSTESPKWARVQGLLSRGGRELGEIIASRPTGGEWGRILKSDYAKGVLDRTRGDDEFFPWDFIKGVPSKRFLYAQFIESKKGVMPPECSGSDECRICDLCKVVAG